MKYALLFSVGLAATWLGPACSSTTEPAGTGLQTLVPTTAGEGPCVAVADSVPKYLERIGCRADFDRLAAAPLDEAIPGAKSGKVVLDRQRGGMLYFQNTNTYPIHWEFASQNLPGNVPLLAGFNQTEYFAPDRRFLLGAVTYYADPKTFVLEMAPYDTASAEMIATLFAAVKDKTYFGTDLLFHPTSSAIELEAKKLPATVPWVGNQVLFKNIDYQPLNLAVGVGQLRFVQSARLGDEFLSYTNIIVLDHAPNDISTVAGIITEEFQTPLSHLNVLSQGRKTPNMGLRNAMTNPTLRSLDGKWVELAVGASGWTIREVTADYAGAWWSMHRPTPAGAPRIDRVTSELRDIAFLVDTSKPLRDGLRDAIPTFGGKATHYSALSHIPDLPIQQSFAIPMAHYLRFMQDNGFFDRVAKLLAAPAFGADLATRDRELARLREDMMHARVDTSFSDALVRKLDAEYPGARMRFRSSSNGEDLPGFTGAGLYESLSGSTRDVDFPLLDAVRGVWASVWNLRAFEEREYLGVDHFALGMGMLVHRTYLNEEANGVAITANPFDPSGLDPAFYINAQPGDVSVTRPAANATPDELLYYFYSPGLPMVYLAHSSDIAPGRTVLTPKQVHELGIALDKIHRYFRPAYGNNGGFYGLEVDYKFNFDPGLSVSKLYIKQARPHPGRGQ